MKRIFERPSYDLSPKDYLEKRTLISIRQFEADKKDELPFNAEFELRFMAVGEGVSLYVNADEFHQLLTDDVARITFPEACEAHKRTAEKYAQTLSLENQQKIHEHEKTIDIVVDQNEKFVQAVFGGEGKE